MTLQQKIMNAFIGKVVRKDLAFLVKGGCLSQPTFWNIFLVNIVPQMTRRLLRSVWKRSNRSSRTTMFTVLKQSL